jgi:hypothetical protein
VAARWHSHYKRTGEGVIAHGEASTRAELLREMKSFMIGHGSCLMSNLIEDAERA